VAGADEAQEMLKLSGLEGRSLSPAQVRLVRRRSIEAMIPQIPIDWRSAAKAAGSAAAWLAGASVVVWALEAGLGIDDASSAYLLAVVVAAVTAGTAAAVLASVGAFLLYDFLFTSPIHSLLVADPQEWLTLLLLLFVGVVVGRLAAGQRERADAAARREREAIGTFRISHTLASAGSTAEALPALAAILATESQFDRVWIALGGDDASERTQADSGTGARPSFTTASVLHRRPGDEPAEWVRVHSRGRVQRSLGDERIHRVCIDSGTTRLGSIWAARRPDAARPTREETRLLSGAADQIARGLERDGLAGEAVDAEIARRSDALKTALLESVSHDLRTPLAAIRAAAGGLADADVPWRPEEARSVAASIDRDAERLSALVTNLLDLSRIEGGALHPDRQPFVLADLVGYAVDRLGPKLDGRSVTVGVPADLPLVLIDPVHLDQALENLLENALRHTPAAAPIRMSAYEDGDGRAVLVIEDGGPGVPDELLPRLFERFFRVVRPREGSRRGTGIGLTVVRGLIESSGGSVTARRSELGGLAIEIVLAVAQPAGVPEPGSANEMEPDAKRAPQTGQAGQAGQARRSKRSGRAASLPP
jgi:two-component system, OmpR family, sensor histidine kinase KdpD